MEAEMKSSFVITTRTAIICALLLNLEQVLNLIQTPRSAARCRRTKRRRPPRMVARYSSRKLRQDVATDRRAASTEIREADRSHASGPPSSSEHKDVRTARPDEERDFYFL